MVSLKSYQTDEISLAVYETAARKVAAEPRRGYLGMSQIGKRCERALWLDVNQAEKAPVEGRIARVFANGHTREDIIIADLEAAGYPVDGRQGEFSDFGGRFSGHRDGVIHNITKMPHLLEIKTANDATFKSFVKNGVKQKLEYFAQMQCYMGYGGQERGLFVVENKNTQELYTERVYFDGKAFDELKAKARRILDAPNLSKMASDENDCYWCPFKHFGCLNPPEKKTVPAPDEPGCSNCIHYWPKEKGIEGSRAIVQSLRLAINSLSSFYKDIPRSHLQSFEALVTDALRTRPDLNIPMDVFYQSKQPVDRFSRILEYVLSEKNGYCEMTFIFTSNILETEYRGRAAAHDWCRHPVHNTKIYRATGCDDFEEVPY